MNVVSVADVVVTVWARKVRCALILELLRQLGCTTKRTNEIGVDVVTGSEREKSAQSKVDFWFMIIINGQRRCEKGIYFV